jgi:hypothetical protein
MTRISRISRAATKADPHHEVPEGHEGEKPQRLRIRRGKNADGEKETAEITSLHDLRATIPQQLVIPRRLSRRDACLRQGKRGRQAEDAEDIRLQGGVSD